MNKTKNNRPDKRTRQLEQARIQNLLASEYYLSGSISWTKGFSTYGGMSKKSSNFSKSNAYENVLINFVQKRKNIENQ